MFMKLTGNPYFLTDILAGKVPITTLLNTDKIIGSPIHEANIHFTNMYFWSADSVDIITHDK